jgi:glycosyltransferase involved in cell wall biosynthesis
MCFAPGDKVTVVPVRLGSQLAKRNFFKRFVQHKIYAARVVSAMESLNPELIISANTPIDIQAAIQKMCRGSEIAFVPWLTDVYSIALKSVVPVFGNLIATRYAVVERSVARNSEGIVAISDDFRRLLIDWGVAPQRIALIENWGVMPFGPTPTKHNDWAGRYGLHGKRVLLYSGALGFKHNPQLFLDLADEFRYDEDVRVVVISEGYGAEWLSRRKRGFPHLLLLPFQPATEFYEALVAADVLIATINPDASEYSVPSKVLTYMAAGRPILAAIPPRNLAARTISAASAGMVVDPEDPIEFRRVARALMDDATLRFRLGEAALAYATANFEIEAMARRFEDVFRRFAGRETSRAAQADSPTI